MFEMNVPKTFWADAVQTVDFFMSRLPTWVLGYKSPIEMVTPTSLFPISPKVFGCICFVHIDKSSKSKLDHKALKCIFLDYSPTQKGYKCYHPSTQRKFVSMDVTFYETSQSSLLGSLHSRGSIVLLMLRLQPLYQYPLSL